MVDQVSVSVKQGEIVGLLGPNGAGKTTTFYMVVGLIAPDEGRVFLNEEDITHLPMYKRAQMGLGYLPQEASVFRKLSVADNIMAILEMTKLTKGERIHKMETLLDEFNLQKVRNNNGDSLSGGERRRTEIARALAVKPNLIVCDEPTSALDVSVQAQILNLLKELQTTLGVSYLFVTHNIGVVAYLADRVAVMHAGEIVEMGDASQILNNPQAIYTKTLLSAVPQLNQTLV